MRLRKAVFAVCGLIGLVAGAALQSQAHTKPDAATLHVYSRETVVDVVVTDAKGQPVHGLTQSDFTLKEDGNVEPIRSFKESGVSAQPAPRELPANVHTNLQPAPASDVVNILLLDFVNTAPDSDSPLDVARHVEMQSLDKSEAIKYLQEMPVGTRVAVIGMSWPSSFRILQGVTSDRTLLSAAVNTLNYVTTRVDGTVKVETTLESLNQLAAVVSQIKGRKNLIWFTYPHPIMTEDAICKPQGCPKWPQRFEAAMGLLTQAHTTVYPIGAPGLPPGGYPDMVAISMMSIAVAGGGNMYLNSNDIKSEIASAVANGSDFYTLSYVPPGTEYDGRHHSIDVKVDSPGVKLLYRDYYYAEDPAKLLPKAGLTLATNDEDAGAGNLHAAMGRAMPAVTQMLFDVRVQPTTQEPGRNAPRVMGVLDEKLKNKPLTRYDFLFLVPVKQITFADGPGGTRVGSVEFDIAAYDADSKPVTSLDQTMQLPLSAEEYRQFLKTPFQFFQQIDLPPGATFLRIGVQDGISKKIGTLEMPLKVAAE